MPKYRNLEIKMSQFHTVIYSIALLNRLSSFLIINSWLQNLMNKKIVFYRTVSLLFIEILLYLAVPSVVELLRPLYSKLPYSTKKYFNFLSFTAHSFSSPASNLPVIETFPV